jgi:2-polyprenyl-3-methyl-5-hydroxy-6-metoxy-1,4-benzoquinol methylase
LREFGGAAPPCLDGMIVRRVRAVAERAEDPIKPWRAYNATPWGRLRLDLIWTALDEHITPAPARVLDVGCGSGETALRFARSGSDVVAVDASPAMVAEVEQRASREDLSLACAVLRVEEIENALATEAFDLVLCHNVLGYVPDPAAACSAFAALLADGGRVSITAANRLAEPLRVALMDHDLDRALVAAESDRLTRASRMTEISGAELTLTDFQEIGSWFEGAGLHVEVMLGIRVVNDYLFGADQLKASSDGYAKLLALELALCDREPYRQIASMLHVIGRRAATHRG